MRRLGLSSSLLLLLLACVPAVTPPPPPPPEPIRTTYRVLGGVSMGAIGSMALVSSNPERFDGVAALGGPLDAAYFQRFLDEFVTGGFCTREQLLALVAQDPVKLNDPAAIDACARVASPAQFEHQNRFNHWHVTTNGGTFDRDSYIEMMGDLMIAYGNFYTDNPLSPVAPPGVAPALVRKPPADLCTNPVRVRGVRNAEYNPDGAVDAITFCDGAQQQWFCSDTQERVDFCSDPANIASPLPRAQEQAFAQAFCASKGGAVAADKDTHRLFWLAHAGRADTCRQQTRPTQMMLAFDFNGNGRRDYGEPLLNNSHERFDDVGADGCGDPREDGAGGCLPNPTAAGADPNGDNYDVATNPRGTERNWRWEQGEPWQDLGLDGVAGTGDKGEGNGAYDLVEGRQRLWALDGRNNFRALSPKAQARLHVLVDGGVRDIFNLGLMARHLFTAVKLARGEQPVGEYRDFVEIPGMRDRSTGQYNPWNRGWRNVPKDLITLYGKDVATDEDLISGEGDHVGTLSQAANRFQTVFNWVANLWPNAPRPQAVFGQSTPADYRNEEFFSNELGAKWEYSVSVPPGYGDPENAQARYPVAYLLHGYGMDPSDFVAAGILANNFVVDSGLQLRPVIYVFPSGRCCYVHETTGQRECRTNDDMGAPFGNQAGWERECNSGTFWVNRKGYTPDDGTRYGDALFELMAHIDSTYRTLPTAEVDAR